VERVIRSPVVAQIPASRAVQISVNTGTPITIAKPGHPVSKAITGLARQRLLPPPAARRRRRGRTTREAA
jgi:pilus assembly protein CpaE